MGKLKRPKKFVRLLEVITDILFYIMIFLMSASLLTTESSGTLVLTIKKAMRRALSASNMDFGRMLNGQSAFDYVASYFFSSLSLLVVGIMIAVCVGMLKGIMDSDRGKNKNNLLGIVTTIFPASLPEILVVILLTRVAIWLSDFGINISVWGASKSTSAYIIPAIAISILPGCYIARIFSSSLDNKYKEDFIRTAYSKGLNSFEVLFHHAIPNALPLLMNSLPALSTICIGNLMIVEYAFSRPGLARVMLLKIGSSDNNAVFAAIIMLSILWFCTYLFFKLTATVWRWRHING